jgi:hypothetical protein
MFTVVVSRYYEGNRSFHRRDAKTLRAAEFKFIQFSAQLCVSAPVCGRQGDAFNNFGIARLMLKQDADRIFFLLRVSRCWDGNRFFLVIL